MGRRLFMPRGKMIGGSSSMNAMLYVRGNSADYDGWAKDGAVGWSYDEVLPYFRSLENFSRGADEYRGADGPLNVTDHRSRTPMTQVIIDAAVEAGIPFNEDYNGAHQEGVGYLQVTQKDGKRWSAADAWLRPALSRKNLTVRTGVQALGVVIDAGGPPASRCGPATSPRSCAPGAKSSCPRAASGPRSCSCCPGSVRPITSTTWTSR